ncbi:hypothetical protein [Tropicimonas sp. IMCC6043]|uniref:hypothetical protein n=1 Tax=Tropicimonas sp. IMCC6043 TaxID=2510645 RepID=UPI00101D1FAD|nr:hypothetical protein [Tropicimonas sp. IMCC6043]RYH06114.1 hypothetical protein EU800_24930 [Tropicimonas sp. IMCC6043]
MVDEPRNDGDENPRREDIRDLLQIVSGQGEQRVDIDLGTPDLEMLIRQMIPTMAASGMFYRYANGVACIERYEAPPKLLVNKEDGTISTEKVHFTAPVICDSDLLCVRLCRLFTFYIVTRDGPRPKPPTTAFANKILGLKGKGLPPLKAVVDYPVIGIDGNLLSQENIYDPDLSIYFAPGEQIEIEKFNDPHAAYRFLRIDWLGEFDFKTEGDFWRAICYAASLLCRRTVLSEAGGNPIFLFVAALSSSGKTALAQAIYLAITGHTLPVSPSEFRNQEELKKSLFAIAMSNVSGVLFDNAPRGVPIRSTALEAYATSDEYTDRILGLSKSATTSTLAIIAITGNNISPGGDMPNRALTVRLAPKTDAPALRTYSKDIRSWTYSHRGRILGALECLLKQVPRDGCDLPTGRFPLWMDIVGKPVTAAARINGCKDPIFDQWMDSAEGEGTRNDEINALCERMMKGLQDAYFIGELRDQFPEELAAVLGIEGEDGKTAVEELETLNNGSLTRKMSVFEDVVTDQFCLTVTEKRNEKTRKLVRTYRAEPMD